MWSIQALFNSFQTNCKVSKSWTHAWKVSIMKDRKHRETIWRDEVVWSWDGFKCYRGSPGFCQRSFILAKQISSESATIVIRWYISDCSTFVCLSLLNSQGRDVRWVVFAIRLAWVPIHFQICTLMCVITAGRFNLLSIWLRGKDKHGWFYPFPNNF